MPGEKELRLTEDGIRSALQSIFSRVPYLQWYSGSLAARGKLSPRVLSAEGAADDFLARAGSEDISPVRFFDPVWFRGRYRVDGVNAFLSYLQDTRQRLAWPSAFFAPRWYCRTNNLGPSEHPLIHFLLSKDDRSPHPLLDPAFLSGQASWQTDAIALEYLVDVEKHRLKPHPLFDGNWYLDKNPDVAAGGRNPLEHYLWFGHAEGRNPNRIFVAAWYRDEYLDSGDGNAHRLEPATAYVTEGFARGNMPAPGLQALSKSSTPLTEHGPRLYLECLEDDRNIYAAVAPPPALEVGVFQKYMSGNVRDYNPSLPEHIAMLPKHRLAVMFTPKCASARIVYWWLDQAKMLDFARKFSVWSHAFENVFRSSRDYLESALSFDPDRYSVYKFVRNPLSRAVSGFTHLLIYPDTFGLSGAQRSMSFMEFLDHLGAGAFNNDPHFRPQITPEEEAGKVSPQILKIEDGLERHFRALESAHGLPRASFAARAEIADVLRSHAKQHQRMVSAGPSVKIPFRVVPDYRALLTPETAERIHALYARDFETYGYSPALR